MTRLERLLAGDSLFIAAHRGYSAKYPENSLLAVEEAVQLGVDLVEVDVYLSKDDVPVLAHDQHLERCSNANGLIYEHTLAELRAFDFGGYKGRQYLGLTITSLEEFIEHMIRYPEVLVTIDFKVYPHTMKTVKTVMPMLEHTGFMDRCIYNSIDCDIVEYLCDTYGKRTVGAPHFYPSIKNFKSGKNGTFSKLWGVCIPQKDLTLSVAQFYRNEGIALVCTSPDTPEQVQLALDCGVVLPLCNDPRNFIEIAQQKNLWTLEKMDN